MARPWQRSLVRCGLWALGLALLATAVSYHDWRRGTIRGDLTRHYMAGAHALARGGDPYSADDAGGEYVYRYFPLNAVLLAPLTLVPTPVSQGIWFAISVGLMAWCVWLHREQVRGLGVPWWVWLGALLVTGRFAWANLKLGQLNPVVYCLAFGGLAVMQRRRWAGAALLGLAASLKYMPSFLLLYLAAKRRWRDAGATLLAIAFWLLLVPTVFLGPARHAELLSTFRQRARGNLARMRSEGRVSGYSLSASLYALMVPVTRSNLEVELRRPVNLVTLSPKVASRIVDAVALAVLTSAVVISYWTSRRRDGPDPHRELLEVGLWFTVLLLISLEVRKAHLITLFSASFALLVGVARPEWRRCQRTTALALLALALLVIVLSSELSEKSTYNQLLSLYGAWTLASLSVFAAAVAALVQWRGPATPPVTYPAGRPEP